MREPPLNGRLQRVVRRVSERLIEVRGGGDAVRRERLACRSSAQGSVIEVGAEKQVHAMLPDVAHGTCKSAPELLLKGEIVGLDVTAHEVGWLRIEIARAGGNRDPSIYEYRRGNNRSARSAHGSGWSKRGGAVDRRLGFVR